LKKVTRSTRPAISSEGVSGCGEESFILVEVYSVGVDLSAANRDMPLSRPVYRALPCQWMPHWLALSVPGSELEDLPTPEAALHVLG
jgi:hypothetical protein